jgi:hypothetical protein
MAHLKLGDYYITVTGDAAKARPRMDDAYRLRDRVGEREKHFIAAQYFQSRDELERSRDSLKVLTTMYPDDAEGHYELALMHYALEELKPAIAEVRRAIALYPEAARPHGTLALLLARDNRPLEAIDATAIALALGVDSPYLYWARGLAFAGAGQLAEARADFDRLGAAPGFYSYLGRLQQARLSLLAGDHAGALTRLTELAAAARRAGERGFELTARIQLALAASRAGQQDVVRAESAAIDVLTSGEGASAIELHDSGAIAVLAGDTRLAGRQLARLSSLEAGNPTSLVRMARLLLAGDLAFHRRDAATAARYESDALSLLPLSRYARGLAEAREALGDWNGAAAAWSSLLDARGQVLQDGFPPDLAEARARLDHARLQQLGHRKDR